MHDSESLCSILALCALLLVCSQAGAQGTRRVTFRVRSAELPPGGAIFVTGSDQTLGPWQSDALKLAPGPDNCWTGAAVVAADRPLEFKVTGGTWETERLNPDGSVPANEIVPAGGDATAEIAADRWSREAPPPPPPPYPLITGLHRVHRALKSRFLKAPRDVIVWLPPSYERAASRRYPVLYMHDGQQVFDRQTSTHGFDWRVDEWCTQLIASKEIEEIIVVAIYSTADRAEEYTPAQRGAGYARFIVEELKPFVDRKYRTRPGRESTAVAGSSMGGKISFHLAWQYPRVFFAAACLSPAFDYRGDRGEIERVQSAKTVPDLRFYLHCGNGDEIEQALLPGMREMAGELRKQGFARNKRLLVTEIKDGQHNEAAWAAVTGEWLKFLFPRRR
jgi:predicted alpha/beta superfamily hydrolase